MLADTRTENGEPELSLGSKICLLNCVILADQDTDKPDSILMTRLGQAGPGRGTKKMSEKFEERERDITR